MTFRTMSTLLALSVTLVGCPGDEPDDTDVGTGTGTEAPDEIAFALPEGFSGIAGTMEYAADSVGFEPGNADLDESCAASFSITGTEFTGDCRDCEWAIELTVTEDANDCDEYDGGTLLTEAAFDGTIAIAYWPEYYGQQATYTDVIAAGSIFDYEGATYVTFDQLVNLDYYGSTYGADSFNFNDEGMDWAISDEEQSIFSDFSGPECDADFAASDLGAAIAGTSSEQDSLPCDQQTATAFDTWLVDATSGDTVELSVDTIADATAFDTWLRVLAPSGCEVAFADDSFDCAFEPADYQCSGTTFTAQETGTYRVIVGSYESCNGAATTGQYVLASSTASITDENDDVGPADAPPTTDITTSSTITVDVDWN